MSWRALRAIPSWLCGIIPRISVKTREEIQRLAREHGYTRDPVVSTLMNQVWMGRRRSTADKLGMLTWWKTRDGELNSPLGSRLYEGVRNRAEHLGYEVECLWAKEPGMTGKRLSSILRARSIRGIFLSNVPYARRHMPLDWANLAAAIVGSEARFAPGALFSLPRHDVGSPQFAAQEVCQGGLSQSG